MLTEQEVEKLKHWDWDRLVEIQCTKPPDVVKKTAELLAEVGRNEEGKQLKGQWVYSVFFVYLLLCAICIEELKLIEFSFTSYNTL